MHWRKSLNQTAAPPPLLTLYSSFTHKTEARRSQGRTEGRKERSKEEKRKVVRKEGRKEGKE